MRVGVGGWSGCEVLHLFRAELEVLFYKRLEPFHIHLGAAGMRCEEIIGEELLLAFLA